jgi:hypothetical protein
MTSKINKLLEHIEPAQQNVGSWQARAEETDCELNESI